MKLIPGLAAVALAATTLATATPALPASAAASVQPAQIAGDWIAGEVAAGLAAGDFDFYPGQLIDGGFALQATDHAPDARAAGDALAPFLVTTDPGEYGYARSTEYDESVNPPAVLQVGRYANATAKAAAFTQRIGRDASAEYADIDLIAQLEELTDNSTGEIADDSFYGNFANTIGQAFAVEALAGTGSTETAAATEALLLQQCPAGFFRLDLASDPCVDGDDVPNPDVTGLAVISLVESGLTSPDVTTAIAEAARWLESSQLADGSFGGDAWTPGSNTNSTGLAGWALGEAGRTESAARAAAWTRRLQVSDAGACASKAPTGAIAHNADDFTSGRTEGLGLKRTTWRLASYQAAPVLSWAPPASGPLTISAPATSSEKSTVTATVSGLAAGEYGCVALGADARSVTGTGADVTVAFELPAGPASHTFSVTTLGGTETATTTVPAMVTPTSTPAPTAVPVVGRLGAAKVERVRNNAFKVAITCAGTVTCAGKLKVRTARKVERSDGPARRLVAAKSAYSVRPGRTATIRLELTRPARAVLNGTRLRVVATQTARGAEPATTTFWLRRR